MTDIILLSETQLQKILTTLESLKSGGVHWEQVIPVFLSAALGMCVGIGLELVKSHREKAKAVKERSKKDVQQINATIVAIAFNIETLLHSVLRFIIPHYKQSHAAYAAFRKTNGDNGMLCTFDLSEYPSFRTMCPEEHFIETDFLDKLPFVIEKNPELLKQSCWINSHARTLNNSIRDRNKYLENAQSASVHSGLNVHQLDNTLKMQAGIANAECVSAFQLFDSLLITAQSLESINATYAIDVKKTKLSLPDTLSEAMNQLKEIKESILQQEVKQP